MQMITYKDQKMRKDQKTTSIKTLHLHFTLSVTEKANKKRRRPKGSGNPRVRLPASAVIANGHCSRLSTSFTCSFFDLFPLRNLSLKQTRYYSTTLLNYFNNTTPPDRDRHLLPAMRDSSIKRSLGVDLTRSLKEVSTALLVFNPEVQVMLCQNVF